jgi:hypothetical protein
MRAHVPTLEASPVIRRASLAIVLCLAGPAFAQSDESPAEPAAAAPAAPPPPAPAAQPEPAAAQPAPANPVQPAAGKPGAAAAKPAVANKPAAAKPAPMIQPAVVKPALAQQPAAVKPGVAQPAAPAPAVQAPAADEHPPHPPVSNDPDQPPDIPPPPGMKPPKGFAIDPEAQKLPPMPTSPTLAVDDTRIVTNRAKYVFASLLLGDPRPLVESSSYPFILEDRRIGSPEELYGEWQKQLRQKRPDLLTLYGIEVLTAADLEKKYGKPPARLVNLPRAGAGRLFYAVANLSGRAAIAVFREDRPHDWRIVGYHD